MNREQTYLISVCRTEAVTWSFRDCCDHRYGVIADKSWRGSWLASLISSNATLLGAQKITAALS